MSEMLAMGPDSRLLILDPVGGASGDMLLAALLDAGASQQIVAECWRLVLPHAHAQLELRSVQRGHVMARQVGFHVDPGAADQASSADHGGRGQAILDRISNAPLPPGISRLASAVFQRLLIAEASVHGTTPKDVVLHQLGELDTILDVVGIAAAMVDLKIGRMLVPALPVGFGGLTGRTHERLPLPAPATLELLKGFALRSVNVDRETVTPTAAAWIATVGTPLSTEPPFILESVGIGAGRRDPTDTPNVLRVLLARNTIPVGSRSLVVVESTIDDLTPELLADAADGVRAVGALDSWITPVVMKKGRPGHVLSALCSAEAQDAVLDAFFRLTSTLGVRVHEVTRHELERRSEKVRLSSGETVRVKIGHRDGVILTLSPEHDDVKAVSERSGRPIREVFSDASAAAETAYRPAGRNGR